MYNPEGKLVPLFVGLRSSSKDGPEVESGVRRGLTSVAFLGLGGNKRVRDQSILLTVGLAGVSKSSRRHASIGEKQTSEGAAVLEGLSGKPCACGIGDSLTECTGNWVEHELIEPKDTRFGWTVSVRKEERESFVAVVILSTSTVGEGDTRVFLL